MAQLYLKGVYYDAESEGFWFLNNSGTYEEISAGGVTIYTGDGSLEGNRVVDINGKILTFGDPDEAFFLKIDQTLDAESITMSIYNESSENGCIIGGTATPSVAGVTIRTTFNDGAKTADILAHANISESGIAYTADTHTFAGAVILPTSDPGVSGAIWNDAGTPAISEG